MKGLFASLEWAFKAHFLFVLNIILLGVLYCPESND